MKTIQDSAAFLFIIAVAILTGVCVLGVWEFFDHDVILKSFETVGLLALVAVVVIFAGRFMGSGSTAVVQSVPNPLFADLRSVTVVILIAASALLAFIGVLSIWDVITDTSVLYKSVGSLAVLAFGAFVMVATCMEREQNPLLKNQGVSVGGVAAALILLYLIFMFSGLFS
ncbi:MAG: hypothetical protein WC050_01010 [Candidatus Paceibacterota bacterium]